MALLSVNAVAAARELLSAPQFFKLVRDALRFRSRAVTIDPLLTAVDQVKLNPAFAQSRLLLRVLCALPSQTGEFRRAEVAALDAPTLALVIDLIDLHEASTRSAQDWGSAIADAEASSL
jgi:hypothetical protein